MAKKKNSAGANARKDARIESTKGGLKRIAGFAVSGASGIAAGALASTVVGGAAILAGGTALASLIHAGARKNDTKATNSRNRGAALDYMAQRAKGGGTNASDLVRGSVSVTRGGKTFTQQRWVKAEPKTGSKKA